MSYVPTGTRDAFIKLVIKTYHHKSDPVSAADLVGGEKPVILLVDDDTAVRQSLSRALAQNDWEIITANNGAMALFQLGKRMPDLLISDLRMAGVSGWDLLFHEMIEHPKLPIFIISALPPEETCGADRIATRFFQKPIDIKTISDVIRDTLLSVLKPIHLGTAVHPKEMDHHHGPQHYD